jgi:three-Cys-motif partner protein
MVAEDDGLPTWKNAGKWTEDKLYFWYRYLDITTVAMKEKPAWSGGLAYVDLFAGTGVCTLKRSGRRIPGSVLIAANMINPFSAIIACEKNELHADACRKRLDRTTVGDQCHVLVGDCNELVGRVIRMIPRSALTLAFIDPPGLDVHFSTIETLARNARVDFVVLFADGMDVSRNAEHVYREDPNSELDAFLGPDSRWREKLDELSNPTGLARRRCFADIYTSQLRRLLGYDHCESQAIYDGGQPLYKLIYFSRHKLGLKFWRQAVKKQSSGQRSWFD